jgi:alanine racemase
VTDSRWAWIEVDLDAVRHNVAALRGCQLSGDRFMAVVKSDGYGHGAVEVGRAALEAGATDLGVSTVAEALQLREAGFSAPVMVLAEPPEASAGTLLDHDVTPALFSAQFARALSGAAEARGVSAGYHLKIDTGMSRIGVPFDDAAEFAVALAELPGLRLEGTFTHLATADVPGDWDAETQIDRFTRALDAMRNERIDPGVVHAANSAATILYPKSHYDMVRCGIAVYGLHPSQHTRGRVDLAPAMSVKAKAVQVKRIAMGEGVSYGLTYRASAPTTVATLPLGYADGIHRVLSNKMQALCSGVRVEQVGRICMDQLMVEIPRQIDAKRGDEFVLVGGQGAERIGLDELADAAGTINYELACALGARLERLY